MLSSIGAALISLSLLGACRGSGSSRHAAKTDDTTVAQVPGLRWRAPLNVAAGGGFAGRWQQNESQFHYVDDPTVALRGNGSAAVAWVDNYRKDVFFQVYDPHGRPGRAAPVNVSRSPRVFSWLPRVVLSERGQVPRVFVLWQEIVFSGGSHGGDIFFSRSDDGGQTFAQPLNLSRSTSGDGKGRLTREHWDNGSLDLVCAPDGGLFAAWTNYEGELLFTRSGDGGQTFSAPSLVTGKDQQPARGPTLAVGAESTVYLAWTIGEDPSADVRVATSRDSGSSFGEPKLVSPANGRGDAPKLATDASGTLHLAYAEGDNEPSAPTRVRYTRLARGATGFEPPRTLSDAVASFPSLAVSRAGAVYVSWEHHPTAGQPAVGLGFRCSRDGGHTFAPSTLVPRTVDAALGVNGSRQGKLMRKLAAAENGAFAVVNSSFHEQEQSRVTLVLGQPAADAQPHR
jgi:hypothetical protein